LNLQSRAHQPADIAVAAVGKIEIRPESDVLLFSELIIADKGIFEVGMSAEKADNMLQSGNNLYIVHNATTEGFIKYAATLLLRSVIVPCCRACRFRIGSHLPRVQSHVSLVFHVEIKAQHPELSIGMIIPPLNGLKKSAF